VRARVCVIRKYWSLLSVTWRLFHSDTFPQSLLSLFLISENNTIHRVSRLVIPGTPASIRYWASEKYWERWNHIWKGTYQIGDWWYGLHSGLLRTEVEYPGGSLV